MKASWRQVLPFAAAILLFALACLSAGYGLSVLIFNLIGYPAGLVRYIISSLISVALFFILNNIFSHAHTRTNSRMPNIRYNKLLENTLEAIDHISRGNFDVTIENDNADPFNELAQTVNRMAKELGSMETLRQEFVSNVSHEIQSPLTSISGYAALLEQDGLSKEERAQYIGIIKAESARLSNLSKNLLRLSSLEAGVMPLTKTKYRLDTQLQKAVVLLEPQWLEKDITIDADIGKTLISADEELLSQVWINLLHNAIKFTPKNGTICITFQFEVQSDPQTVCCTIADNGVGIAPEDQAHIFERFYKTDKSRDRSLGGNGLGLSIVKKIVELHGGTVTVESEIGKGTAFAVTLPLS